MAALPETARATDMYERYASRLYGFCLHRLGSREEAEDAVQTTFLNAFRGLSRGVVPESESAWLFKIAENVCLSRHRAAFRRRRVEAPADLAAVEETVAAPPRADDELIPLEDALAEMPEAQRRALLLREWQGLSYREIAAELEVSQSAVETLIFRARRSLARRLEAPRERLRRVGQAIDVGAALAALKGALSTGAVVKAAVIGAAVTGLVAGVAEDRPQPRRHDAPPASAAAPTKQRNVTRAPQQRIDAPRPSFAPTSQQRVVPRAARPKRAAAAKRHVVVAPAPPRATSRPRAAAPSPPVSAPASEPEAPQGKAHEQQPAKSKPAGKPAAAKSEKPDPAPKPKSDELKDPGPPADKGPSADPGAQGKANGKDK